MSDGGPPSWSREDDPESADAATGPGVTAADLEQARALFAATGRTRHRQWLGSRRRQAFAGVVVLGAIGYIAFQGLTNAAQYFLTTKQAVAQKATLGARPFRIEGSVEHDVRAAGRHTDFDIYADGVAVRVVSTGTPPQLFRPGIPVVLVGHWAGTYFASDEIMVKHSASYKAAHRNRLRSQLPRQGGS